MAQLLFIAAKQTAASFTSSSHRSGRCCMRIVVAVMHNTTAGGMTQNDTIMHVAIEELPFGGVGPSGLGSYHGHAGFKTFSHAKSIFRAGAFGGTSMLRPPYGPRLEKMINMMVGK